MAESITVKLLADDQASAKFVKTGRAAAAASDDVLGLAKRLDEVGKKSETARVGLAGDKEALAKLDQLDHKLLIVGRKVTADVSVDGAEKASLEITKLNAELDKLGVKSEDATASVGPGTGGLSGASGLGALIGAGVVLTPIIATLATGTAGFAAAAYGAAAPIMKAAQATGGLQKNMHTLNPEQQQLAKSILGLGKQYGVFQKALQPEVLGVFGKGIKLAGDLMHQMEPVAKATGKALGGLLGSIDAEFKSGTWNQFFGFMAATAAPDMKLLGTAFTTLMDALPGLLEALQPVATGFLNVTIDGLRVVDMASKLPANLDKASQSGNGLQKALAGIGKVLVDPAFGLGIIMKPFEGMSRSINVAALDAGHLDTASNVMAATLANYLAPSARLAGTHIAIVATDVTKLMTAQQKALNVQTTYAGDLVTTANDAHTLAGMLKLSSDRIGLHTQAQRNSFGAANTYITDLGNTASAAYSSGKGVDAAIKAISDGLPVLDAAKTKSRAYWAEVKTLTGWLDKLRAEKNIREQVIVTGSGSWTMHNPKNQSLPGGFPGGTGAARGMLVSGGIPGKDSVLIRAMPGELVVPTPMVSAGAVDHLRGQIPGFSAGGVVPRFAGSLPGLGNWLANDDRAAINSISTGIARSIASAITSVGAGFGHAGPGGGAPGANAALARRMFPNENFSAWNYVAMRESGWNQFALNPTSGAYGIAQALPPTKYPFAGQAAGGSNPAAQISWMEGYMQSRYGGASGAAAHEQAFNWYDSGHAYLPPGLSLAMNGTGRPERVGGEDLAPLLRELIRAVHGSSAATGHAMAQGLQGTARRAGARGMYSARGAWA